MITKDSTQKEIIDWWVAALRSGEYAQGKILLKANEGNGAGYKYCCLGVIGEKICEVFDVGSVTCDVDMWLSKEQTKVSCLTSPSGCFAISDEIASLVKPYFEDIEDYLNCIRTGHCSLSHLNDEGVPFHIIADIIEMRPIGLFADDNRGPAQTPKTRGDRLGRISDAID